MTPDLLMPKLASLYILHFTQLALLFSPLSVATLEALIPFTSFDLPLSLPLFVPIFFPCFSPFFTLPHSDLFSLNSTCVEQVRITFSVLVVVIPEFELETNK